MPELKQIDLSKALGHSHPDIKTDRTFYLARIDGNWHTGTFGHEWYGLNFRGWYNVGLQFDAPGSNESQWEELWEMVIN